MTPELSKPLFDYIGGIIRGEGGSLLTIGGVADHVHLLIRWRPDGDLSSLMRRVKGNSSRWVHETHPGHRDFGWQEGYTAFTVSRSAMDKVREYIGNQEAHHRRQDHRQELRALLEAHGVEFDEKHL